MKTDVYKITDDLEEKGWLYDDTGVYVPYTHKNEECHDNREVFLKIERQTSKQELNYTFVKFENGLFYPLSTSYKSETLINEYDKYLIKKITSRGIFCSLNTRQGIFKDFVAEFKEAILNADCLDILKISDFTLPNSNNLINLTVPYKKDSHHNFMDMRELFKLATGLEPTRKYPNYNQQVCPFHDSDSDGNALVYSCVFKCTVYKKQYDQTEFLMELFDLDAPEEAETKFQELKHNS